MIVSSEMHTKIWSNLPSANQIDEVLEYVRSPAWGWQNATSEVAFKILHTPDYDTEYKKAHDKLDKHTFHIYEALWRRCVITDGGALLALVVYPNCAHMLELTPEQLKIYIGLGIPGASLLYTYVAVKSQKRKGIK